MLQGERPSWRRYVKSCVDAVGEGIKNFKKGIADDGTEPSDDKNKSNDDSSKA